MAESDDEQEWLASDEPGQLLDLAAQPYHVRVREYSERKFRLWSCACCRHVWHLLTFANSREVVELAERYADGLTTRAELEAAAEILSNTLEAVPRAEAEVRSECEAAAAVIQAAWTDDGGNHGNQQGAGYVHLDLSQAAYFDAGGEALELADWHTIWEALDQTFCDLLRDILGNPFCPVAFDPAWLSSTVVTLAESIYADRAFDRLPILADAIQEAGCEDKQVLGHCRDGRPHVRGCWVVDLVLGKQ